MKPLRAWLVIVACAVVVVPSFVARSAAAESKAERDQRAKDLYQRGDTAYAEARYEDALAAFQEAYDLSERPQLLFNIANALERLARYSEAVSALEKYLASGKAKDQAVVQSRLANLKRRVAEQKKEEDAKKQHDEEEQKRRDADEAKRRKAAEPPPPPKPTPILPWALIGGGGVFVVTGAVFGVLTLGARSDAKSGCTDAPAGHLCNDSARAALDREKTFGVIADVGVLAGLVLGGAGAYLLLFKPDAPRVQVSGRGIDLVGHF